MASQSELLAGMGTEAYNYKKGEEKEGSMQLDSLK